MEQFKTKQELWDELGSDFWGCVDDDCCFSRENFDKLLKYYEQYLIIPETNP